MSLTIIIGVVTAIATAIGVFWKVFYGKEATERKLQKLDEQYQEVVNESQKAYQSGDMAKHLVLDVERVRLAEKRNRILRRLGQTG